MRGPDRRRGGSPLPPYRDDRRGPPMDDRRGPPMDDRRGPPMDDRRGPPMDDRRGPPMDDRRGPPPMDRGFLPPPPMDRRRRGRSPSPPMERYRRSPPPKRFRRDDDFDRFGPPPGRYDGPPPPHDRRGPPFMGGPPPQYREHYNDRRDGPYGPPDPYRRDYPPSPPPRRTGPMTYKELMRELPDDITPEDAQKEYQAYLARWWGSEVKAQFEAQRNDDAVRRRFDPREHQKAVEARNELAVTTARSFLEDWETGNLDPASLLNQGNGSTAAPAEAAAVDKPGSPAATSPTQPGSARSNKSGAGADAKPADDADALSSSKVVPEVAWQPARIVSDLALAKQLAAKLDTEKGIQNNLLLEDKPAAANGSSPVSGGSSPVEGGSPAAPPKEQAADPDAPEQQVGRLDVMLTYLWRVHGVDYYGGAEVAEPDEEQRGGPRPTLRCPRPEEGEQADEAAEREQAAILEKGVDDQWRLRLASGDPFEAPLKKEEMDKAIVSWIDSQIVKIDDKKWGSKISQKLFVDREYVVKHIRNKHRHLLDAQREQLWDDMYFEAFKEAKDEEERKAKEEAEAARRADGNWDGGDGSWGGADTNGGGFPAGGLPAPFVGGGGMRGGMAGMMDVPAGCVLVPAPGAGPLGPFIPVPMDEAPQHGAIMGGRGGGVGRGGRGRGPMAGGRGMGGPPGGRGMGGGGPMARGAPRFNKEYVDLDDPANQRTVLDYGDL